MDFTKRYWVFMIADYYPSGGLNDVRDTVDDLEAAIDHAKSASYYDVYVFDRETGKKVWTND